MSLKAHLPPTLAVMALFHTACGRTGPPYSPEESLRLMRLEPGFRIERFAAEPMVVSPVAIEFDENGRIYVVEDRGYPLDVDGRAGRVKLLEDTNGDGYPDKSTVFADRLVLPTGVMRWKNGILVTDAPDVWYFEDTNGDGVADVKRKVLTGFALTNPQHTVNSPVYGLDNWIYLAHENPTSAIIFKDKFGDRGGDIRYADRTGAAVVAGRGRNIRFRPDTGEIEALSGSSQFGHAFDEWGHHFTLNNTYHARQEVIAARYLKRNPDLPLTSAQEEISDHGTPAKVFPLANIRIEMLSGVGEFTSACGLTWLGGGFALVAEPAHNLVHRDRIVPAGAAFRAQRTREQAEFLASEDPWFRPVNFALGPDGAIYMLDYYRLVIEHPEWMSEARSQAKELYAGNDRGRIYRITGEGQKPVSMVRLGQAPARELVAALANPNAWWRRTAQRLLVDRKPAEAVTLLEQMARSHESSLARLHALWTLEGFGKLETQWIVKALEDPVAGVRENAVILSETRLAGESGLADRLLALADDPDARVRFQLLATLGFVESAAARAARDKLLLRDIEDRWVQIAALSASPQEALRLIQLGALGEKETAGRTQFFRQAAAVIGASKRVPELEAVLGLIRTGGEWRRAATLEGLAAGLRAPLESARARRILLSFFASEDRAVRRGALRLLEAFGVKDSTAVDRAAANAIRRDADADLRADSVALVALADAAGRRAFFEKLVDPKEPEAVQAAAVRALGRVKGPETAKFLLARWRGMTSAVRLEAADAIYRDPERIPLVVAALKSGQIQPWTLEFRHKRALIMHRDPAIRQAARPILEADAGERAQVMRRYQAAASGKGDLARGQQVYERVCAKCHKLNGKGAEVGPDLATVRNQPRQVLLEDILNPNRSISQGFEAYVVETVSGGTIDGVMGPQTASTITLRHEEGKQDIIQRKDIKQIHVTDLSAMPADLDKQIDVRQMTDLLEYLKSSR
ncbi:MAG: c-type cytochrome [Acidobacteria bacterium]|nr:c-type cytochrome [Acidobacteriota bacterium]